MTPQELEAQVYQESDQAMQLLKKARAILAQEKYWLSPKGEGMYLVCRSSKSASQLEKIAFHLGGTLSPGHSSGLYRITFEKDAVQQIVARRLGLAGLEVVAIDAPYDQHPDEIHHRCSYFVDYDTEQETPVSCGKPASHHHKSGGWYCTKHREVLRGMFDFEDTTWDSPLEKEKEKEKKHDDYDTGPNQSDH